ncbi:LOW QUALITY PROTEIN: Glycosyl hydrolase 5 family protein [Paramyrothecium foliicola]|nr:LOW QUALITY PROTEIN: Glycosyl hydrolase 5 family protein [Paramyrothecium foliicola]
MYHYSDYRCFGECYTKQTPFLASWAAKNRRIVDHEGDTFIYAGVNWPGEGETMEPEGLQYSSIADIVSKITSLNMNSVRMGWATEMVDDILDNGGDVTIRETMNRVLGPDLAEPVIDQIIEHNPQFTEDTTRLQVWDDVATELQIAQLHMIVHNHVSKAVWCCSGTDGNGWFEDTYFDVAKWKRSLDFMTKHAKKNWPAATAHSLRNELRPVESSDNATYGWSRWYDEMNEAAAIVNAADPDGLIIYSGLNYDHELNPITAGTPLTDDDPRIFELANFDYADKIVFELHTYDNWMYNCTFFQTELYKRGFNALDNSSSTTARNIAPVIFTEFGFAQNGSDYLGVYAQCLKDFITGDERIDSAARIDAPIGWLEWSLGGSYYMREGVPDHDDWWALLNHDWSDWRNHTVLDEYQVPMVKAVQSYFGN